ncbi:MAG: YggS family pyridoxal phosphate-dependent enzyme [Anaerolineae bacterium]|nr:YggS family pyridoxal phosphate-dependent enzyme [Anaerolineae bacterium]
MTDLESNLRSVQERVAAAARRAGRDPAEITLVAVSKGQPISTIHAAYDLGLRHLGENRADEAALKTGDLPTDITWHMIGHVQSRQARQVASLFDTVHSVDSAKLARRLSRFCGEQGKRLPILLEINVSGEASKYGFAADQWPGDDVQRETLLAAIQEIATLPDIEIQGLMAMAPIVADAEQARPVFARLRRMRDELAAIFPQVTWRHLSMGMTDDFEAAIEEGATLVRVGRAIFAPDAPAWCQIPRPIAEEDR